VTVAPVKYASVAALKVGVTQGIFHKKRESALYLKMTFRTVKLTCLVVKVDVLARELNLERSFADLE
jgi:hypothetical protein